MPLKHELSRHCRENILKFCEKNICFKFCFQEFIFFKCINTKIQTTNNLKNRLLEGEIFYLKYQHEEIFMAGLKPLKLEGCNGKSDKLK